MQFSLWNAALCAASCLALGCGSDTHHGSHSAIHDAAVDAGADAGSPLHDSGSPVDADVNGNDAAAADAALAPDSGPLSDDIPDGPNIVKMVAPSVCTASNGYLFKCHFGPVDLEPASVPMSGRFKTHVTGHRKGDCTSLLPFVATLSADGIAPSKFDLVTNGDVFLRRDDDAALSSLHVREGSNFAGKGDYHDSCRVWLEVEFNVPISG